jgi:WS/DGAT/MGAT family acyltransferase
MSALESAFLGIGSGEVPFVYEAILDFDREIPLDALRARVDDALSKVRRYHQRIERGRFGRAAWVDDDHFRIARHVHEATAAAPGSMRELEQLAAQLFATDLPAGHPPWRLWTVRGLAGGHGAVIAMVHHSLVDGIAALRLLEHILGAAPREDGRAPERPHRGKLAGLRSLLARRNLRSLSKLLRGGLSPASDVGLNPRRVSRERAVTSFTVEQTDLEAIQRAHGVTHNDVVLAAVAGALQRFLLRRGIEPRHLHDVRAMVPVGRRRESARDTGNQVVLLLVKLPVRGSDPVERLHHVSQVTGKLKSSRLAGGGDLLVALSEATTPALLTSVLRLALRMRAFNLIITNVPGPARPLSLAGIRLARIIPIVNLWPHQSLGIAVATYAGRVSFGLHCDRAVISERELLELRDDLAEELAALRGLSPAARTAPSRSASPAGHPA